MTKDEILDQLDQFQYNEDRFQPKFEDELRAYYETLPEEYKGDKEIAHAFYSLDSSSLKYIDEKFLKDSDFLISDENDALRFDDSVCKILEEKHLLDRKFAWKIYETYCHFYYGEELDSEILKKSMETDSLTEAYHFVLENPNCVDLEDIQKLYDDGLPSCLFLNVLKKEHDNTDSYVRQDYSYIIDMIYSGDFYGSWQNFFFIEFTGFDSGFIYYCQIAAENLDSLDQNITLDFMTGLNTAWMERLPEWGTDETIECLQDCGLLDENAKYEEKHETCAPYTRGFADFSWGYPQFYVEKKWQDLEEETRNCLLKEKITVCCDDVIIDYKLNRKNYGKKKRIPDSEFSENMEFCSYESRWMKISKNSENLKSMLEKIKWKIIEFDGTVKEWLDFKYSLLSDDNSTLTLCEDGTVMPVAVSHEKSPLPLAYVCTNRGFAFYHGDYPDYYIEQHNYFGLIYYVQRYLIMTEGRAYMSFGTEISYCLNSEEEKLYDKMQQENPDKDFNYRYDALDFDNFQRIDCISGIS